MSLCFTSNLPCPRLATPLPKPQKRVASLGLKATGSSAGASRGFFEPYSPNEGNTSTTNIAYDRASASEPSRPSANSKKNQKSQDTAKQFLESELKGLFDTGKLTKEKYDRNFSFQDPVVNYKGIDTFSSSLATLRALFRIDFVLHSIAVGEDRQIITRWTMEMTPRLTPFIRKLVFTGKSYYTVDDDSGKIMSQRDVWDAVQDNNFLSLEGVAYIVRQLTSGQTSPNLESPKYAVWKKTKEYEIRRYSSFLAAEVSMPNNAKPASGDGFNDLAGYIFGGNKSRDSMEMTTPVFTTAGQGTGGKMSFPMEEKMGDDADQLPEPSNSKVSRTMEDAATVAVGSFGGFPLDFEVTDAERRLRGALVLDGLEAEEGYKLARYNDPFTPPFLRRNEILIRLKDYELEQAD